MARLPPPLTLLLHCSTLQTAAHHSITQSPTTTPFPLPYTQLELLSEQLETERQERAFRERVQTAMAAKLEAESRAKQAAALKALKDQLDHNEAMDFPVTVY